MQLNKQAANREIELTVVRVTAPPSTTGGVRVAADQPVGQNLEHELDDEAYERAAAIFRALGDPRRLRMLSLLKRSEYCVSDLSQLLDEPMPAISQRLRLLKSERIVRSRRVGKRVYYALADEHIFQLVSNALLHALE